MTTKTKGLELPKNVASVKAAKLKHGKRTEYRIEGERGLRLHLYPPTKRHAKGQRVWFVHWFRREGGKLVHKAVSLGDATAVSLADACEGRARVFADLSQGRDPAAERRAERQSVAMGGEGPGTFGYLFSEWLERHAKKKLATWPDEERRYQLHLQEPFGTKPFVEIQRKDVREVRDTVLEKAGPIQSNRVVALFNRVMNWAVDEDFAQFNPAARLRKVGEEKRRERVLTDDELKRIWSELDAPLQVKCAEERGEGGLVSEADLKAAKAVRRAIKLLCVLGQRRSETIEIAKAELDLDGSEPVWTIPAERTKNGLPHRVPLTPLAVEIFHEALADAGDSPYVFPSSRTDAPLRGDTVTKAIQRLCGKMKPKIEGLGPHDIRRTVGQTMRKLGVSVEDRGYVFNHISGAKAKVTSWNYDPGEHDDEKRAALEKWERELKRIVGLGGGKVIKLRRAKQGAAV